MFNLAPIKYANCFASDGGPLHSVEESSIEINGQNWTVANSRLCDEFRTNHRDQIIFATMDGTGLDPNPLHARYKAISEAIERWAHRSVTIGEDRSRYGFEEDSSSNGMAAFPGLFARQARKYAFNEAVERYSLVAWWEQLLAIELVDVDTPYAGFTYRILHPFKNHEVAIVRKKTAKGYTVFGYGSGREWDDAVQAASLEQERSRIMLGQFFKRNPFMEVGDLSTISNAMERRLIYFSMPEGVEAFEKKLEATFQASQPPEKPEILFDGEIKGPWSRYATVWRVAFRMPSYEFLNPDCTFFYW